MHLTTINPSSNTKADEQQSSDCYSESDEKGLVEELSMYCNKLVMINNLIFVCSHTITLNVHIIHIGFVCCVMPIVCHAHVMNFFRSPI